MHNNELSKFEEQILNYVKEIELNLMERINNKDSEISENLNNFQLRINHVLQNSELIRETLTNQQLYKTKLLEFDSFKNKADDILISHEVRLQSNISDIDFLKCRYDKIIKENLLVPGYIGTSCPYKNLADFLSYNIIELNKIKTDKDDRKKDVKDLKFKFDNIMKTMVNLNDGTIERCKDYTNHIQKDIVSYIENKLKEFENKIFEIKTEIYKYNSINEQKIIEINQKVVDTQKELNDIINDKIEQIKNNHTTLKDKIDANFTNIEKNTQDIKSINENIKEININIKDNISNLQNLISSLNNNFQGLQGMQQGMQGTQGAQQGIQGTQSSLGITNNGTSPKKILKKTKFKADVGNPLLTENIRSNKINNIGKSLINDINNNRRTNIKLKTLKTIRNNKQRGYLTDKKERADSKKYKKENAKEIDDDEDISDIDNYNKQKNISSSIDSSFEDPKKNKIKNNYYKHYSNNNLNIYRSEQFLKNKITPTEDSNKFFKRETINAKSLSPMNEEQSTQKKEIIQRYKSRESNRNLKTQKFLNPHNSHIDSKDNKDNNTKSEKEIEHNHTSKQKTRDKEKDKEKEKEKDKENEKEKNLIRLKNEKKDKKLKLNYDLINDIHKNKVLDLYSFSTSPPDGKINFNYWTISDNLTEKFLKRQKKFEIEKETGVNLRVVQIGMNNANKNIKNISSQNNIKNNKNIFPMMKNKNNNNNYNRLSFEKYNNTKNIKNIKTTFVTNTSNNFAKVVHPNFEYRFNRTSYDNNDKNKNNNINYENMKLRNTMKELKINDNNIHSLTYK